MFYNLFENSVRHGGKVTEITITAGPVSQGLRILISDDGLGISEGDKEMIFKRGFGKNTGLGLFLVREILSITGILIDEISSKGEGACFELIVPSGNYRIITP